MAATLSRTDHAPRLTADGESPRPAREAYLVLERLLKTLFPEEPPLDVITVANILYRYPLTGFKAPALTAIEQSQRMVRSRADFGLMGQSEFHVGLIYLYWDDCRAAANHFAAARQSWSLVSDTAAICLAHYAQGLALFHAHHNEPAMLQYGRAERLMNRTASGDQAKRLAALRREMAELLKIAQATLREMMWPKDQVPPELLEAGYLTVPTNAAGTGTAAQRDGEPPARPQAQPRPPAELPAERPEWAKRVPQPISQLPGSQADGPRGPVPGHVTTDDRFGWYMIGERRGGFLPAVSAGAWLLADREVDERPPAKREYVVVGSARADLGSIAVRPISHSSAVPYCFLGQRLADEATPGGSRLVLDDSGQAPAAHDAFVLAVVEGFWYGLSE
jgi:hypothetical protein